MITTDVGHVISEGVLIKYTEFIFNLFNRGLGVETRFMSFQVFADLSCSKCKIYKFSQS